MKSDTRWLLLLCLTQLFIMLVFLNYSAVLPLLHWAASNALEKAFSRHCDS